MKIGIDARLYGTQHGGIGRYLEELIRVLQILDTTDEYVVFCNKDSSQIPRKKGWKKRVVDVAHYSIKEQVILPAIFNKENLDLLHVPHFNVPIFYRKPFVVTIHDLFWNEFRGFGATTLPALVYLIKYIGFKLVLRHAVLYSRTILVPSQTIKKEILKHYSVSKEEIVFTYEGGASRSIAGKKGDEKTLLKYNIDEPYLLYIGSLYPHKNIESVVLALKKIKEDRRPKLVVVGGASAFGERFKKFVQQNDARDFVNLVGYVPDQELGSLYKNSIAFIFPTISEGFGLPGLEAMSLGVPVLASNIPALREVYGDAALYFNPKNVPDIKNKIEKIIRYKRVRTGLIKKGKQRAKKYSWREMAKQTLQVYREVLANSYSKNH